MRDLLPEVVPAHMREYQRCRNSTRLPGSCTATAHEPARAAGFPERTGLHACATQTPRR